MRINEFSIYMSIPENGIMHDALTNVDDPASTSKAQQLLRDLNYMRNSWARDFLQTYTSPTTPLYRNQQIGIYTKAHILYKRLADPFLPSNEYAQPEAMREQGIRILANPIGRKVISKALSALNETEDCHDILAIEQDVTARTAEAIAHDAIQPAEAGEDWALTVNDEQTMFDEIVQARLSRCFLLQAMIQDLDIFGH